MNKQLKTKDGKVIGRGIEWTDYTWNVVGGCEHGCEWRMQDGTIAICYADTTSRQIPKAYPEGFKHHYYRPHLLNAPLKVTEPSKVFMDSMSDLMGHWVPEEQIDQVLSVCAKADWHIFQLLTKNAPRLLKFALPPNLWAGVSAPPTFMHGKELTPEQQRAMVMRQLDILSELKKRGHPVCWMSIEPLSFDIAETFCDWMETHDDPLPLDWSVIGAASNGPRYFQPNPGHVENLHHMLRLNMVKIFHKGNLKWDPHLEEFPATPCPA